MSPGSGFTLPGSGDAPLWESAVLGPGQGFGDEVQRSRRSVWCLIILVGQVDNNHYPVNLLSVFMVEEQGGVCAHMGYLAG